MNRQKLISPHRCEWAFSLVELSIVLVILGLLTGGILAGQSLIRASELRAVSTEAQTYVTALNTFRDKYFGLPGDLTNATTIWGIAGGTGTDTACNTAVNATEATCNGNGDGWIGWDTHINENTLAWQQMQNSGLIAGRITNTTATLGPTNLAVSKFPNGVWFIGRTGANGSVSGSANVFNGYYGNGFNLAVRTSAGSVYGLLTANEMWNIDTKLDDSVPYAGRVVANWSATFSQSATACTNATSGADFTATYNLANSSKDCLFYYRRL